MPQVVGPVDHGSPVLVSIAGATPQVFAYRLWTRRGADAWELLGEGSTATAGPHEYRLPFIEGLQLYYWIGVGGHPNAVFECSLTLAQQGGPIERGRIRIGGQLDASGVAAAEDWVNVL
jgi:hypothetical protein